MSTRFFQALLIQVDRRVDWIFAIATAKMFAAGHAWRPAEGT
jgi:hypothetical protein